MTQTEQCEYNKLSLDQKGEYDYQKGKHPDWDHSKLMVKVGFNDKVDSMLEQGRDVDPDDKDVMQSLVEGVGDWLERTLPRIWEGVKNLFSSILEGIISGVIEFFGDVLAAIF